MPALNADQIKQILHGISIPPQPQILVDLQMEQVMPDPDINQIAKLISQDVGLSGTVLKVVNSPFFGLTNRISSVQQAVNLIGISSVVNIVNGISIKSEMSDETIVSMNRFWDTAMDIAMTASAIAKQVGFRNPDEAYALGLFHNAGIPLMMNRFDDYLQGMEESYASQGSRIIDVENRKYSSNHAVIGYYTAKSWNLPTHLCNAIAEHHDTARIFSDTKNADNDKKTLLAILKMAEHICGNYRILGNQDEDYEWDAIQEDVLEYLGLSDYDLNNMMENFAEMGVVSSNYAF